MNILHDTHPSIFDLENALWVRKLEGELPTEVFHDEDYGLPQLVELCVALVAERASAVALLGIAVEVDDDDLEDELEMVPVAVYYYAITDEGRTDLDAVLMSPIDPDEEFVEPPEWFHDEAELD